MGAHVRCATTSAQRACERVCARTPAEVHSSVTRQSRPLCTTSRSKKPSYFSRTRNLLQQNQKKNNNKTTKSKPADRSHNSLATGHVHVARWYRCVTPLPFVHITCQLLLSYTNKPPSSMHRLLRNVRPSCIEPSVSQTAVFSLLHGGVRVSEPAGSPCMYVCVLLQQHGEPSFTTAHLRLWPRSCGRASTSSTH